MDLDFPEISKPKGLGSSSMHGSCNYLPTYLFRWQVSAASADQH